MAFGNPPLFSRSIFQQIIRLKHKIQCRDQFMSTSRDSGQAKEDLGHPEIRHELYMQRFF